MTQRQPTKDALKIMYDRYFKDDPEALDGFGEELANIEVAQKIFKLRKEAGLTQKQLAEMIGTSPSVISRLEDADYQGHSLAMLRRIAEAMGKRVEIRFVSVKPEKGKKKSAVKKARSRK
jgi:DNA-binding XRE family transcriptional regulator